VFLQPFIEVFNYPLARYCSNGNTGVVVNGRELHHKDFEVLKQCGLWGTLSKACNLDLDGHLFVAVSGMELLGLDHLAPMYVKFQGFLTMTSVLSPLLCTSSHHSGLTMARYCYLVVALHVQGCWCFTVQLYLRAHSWSLKALLDIPVYWQTGFAPICSIADEC
jgi:hypothetical protein